MGCQCEICLHQPVRPRRGCIAAGPHFLFAKEPKPLPFAVAHAVRAQPQRAPRPPPDCFRRALPFIIALLALLLLTILLLGEPPGQLWYRERAWNLAAPSSCRCASDDDACACRGWQRFLWATGDDGASGSTY
jgi:hypothetical protein